MGIYGNYFEGDEIGFWASLRTRVKLIIHASNPETNPAVSLYLAKKLQPMKILQHEELLLLICRFRVEEETDNSTIGDLLGNPSC
ncbi:hypothetical protein LAZ67_8000789 [Cordylochernes scorpioides]|uniref:Uncharacterized protein n=1 Tax=Cordylochernes scorpioides TaxID=51811 RepID=A0ABY6KPP5_9ARAC|nr:hypothetical protein LAZ67_8000789 [Cordylochernes scorpioides]